MKNFGEQEQEEKKKNNLNTTYVVPNSKKPLKISSKITKDKIISQAVNYHLRGNLHEAIKYYQYFIDQGLEDSRVFSNYGAIYQQSGQLNKAIELYKKSINLDPNSPEAYSNLGKALKDLGNLKEAEKVTRKAIKLNTKFLEAYSNLGTILKDQGNLEEAEQVTRKAIKLNPNYAEAYSNLGNILCALGNLEEAELATRKAIQIKPNLSITHNNLGIILYGMDKLKEAEQVTRKAIKLSPNYAEAYSNLGNILCAQGNLETAETSIRKAIKIDPNHIESYSNLGVILKDLGKFNEAEIYIRKAIELNPKFTGAYNNLASILKTLGKLEEAEKILWKAIETNAYFARAYYSLSTFKVSSINKVFLYKLFSKKILKNQSVKDQIYLYFARANILHKQKKFKASSKYLILSNNLKLSVYRSNAQEYEQKSNQLLDELNKLERNKVRKCEKVNHIFIVGMPRSGTTLLESIISMNSNVYDLGEVNILEESFLEWKPQSKANIQLDLNSIYSQKIHRLNKNAKITTNKWLYNYQYTGIIASQIPNSRIIHCFRNPLDNILSIYRAHFAQGNKYSSSLEDCAKVYLDHDQVMKEYKKKYRSQIYDLNYDLLVTNPNDQIRSLIAWLGWDWEDSYLSPHLNPRSVSTASSVQVRSPINAKSIGGWKNYREMLKPAIEILINNPKYRDIIC